jgi:hypothetical protein
MLRTALILVLCALLVMGSSGCAMLFLNDPFSPNSKESNIDGWGD